MKAASDNNRARAWKLPQGARVADAVVVGLLVLAVLIAVYPFRVDLPGLSIGLRNWLRPLAIAAVVAAARHAWISTPSLWMRVVAWHNLRSHRRLRHALPLILALVIPSTINAAILVRHYDGDTYLRGDCPYYYWTAVALLRDHSIVIGNQLPGGWRKHVNQISLSRTNQPVPKHPIVMPVLSLPFVAVMGESGALAFNVLQTTVLIGIMYGLARAAASAPAASVATVATYAASFLPHYVWNYSPDLCAAMLLLGGTLRLVTAKRMSGLFVGGLLVGAACVAKYASLLFLPGSLLLAGLPIRRMLAASGGIAIPLAGFALMNLLVFGSPVTTSYDRIAANASDESVYSQRDSFTLPVSVGFRGQIFDQSHGLLHTSPVTLVALLGVPFLLVAHRRLGIHVVFSSLALFLFYSKYDQWNTSHYGNRFLIPMVCAFAVPLASAIDRGVLLYGQRKPAEVI